MSTNNVVIAPSRRSHPLISVIIPSLDGYRGGNVERLKEDLKRQTIQDYEVIVVVGVKPNGKARNVGVRHAKGKYLVCIDDDVRLGDNHVLENLLRPFEKRKDIGMTGASQLIPEDSNLFQRESARQLPRNFFPVQRRIVDSDMVSHMCLCIPTQLYKDVGWENEEIKSGTDPDLRHRVRQAGYRVVVVPHTWAYHPMPRTREDLWRMCYNKGRDSAWVQRHFPHLVLELDSGMRRDFAPRQCVPYRAVRAAAQLVTSLVEGRWTFLFARSLWIWGVLAERFWYRRER